MANEFKTATLVKEGSDPLIVKTQAEADTGFAGGFTLPEAVKPLDSTVSSDIKPVAPEIINKTSLQDNIQSSLDVNPNLPANEAFIQGLAKFSGGQPATAEQLALSGKTLSEVIGEFRVGEQFKGFGITEPVEVEETAVTEQAQAPSTQDLISKGFDELITQIKGGTPTQADTVGASQKLTEAQTTVNDLRTQIQTKGILDLTELKNIEDRPIANVFIRNQQADFSDDQKLDNMLLEIKFNNALVSEQIAQGNFTRAESINKEIAGDNFQIAQIQLQKLQQQGVYDEKQTERIDSQLQAERDLALEGYIKIEDPADLAKLTEDQIFRDPVSGNIYKKPAVEAVTPDFQFVTNTENQPGGFFNKNTGTFTLFNSSSPTGAGNVATSTGAVYDIGSYATDPNHETAVQGMLSKIGQFRTEQDIDNYIQSVAPTSKITGKMVASASEKHGVSWEMMVAIMQQDSSLGTKGLGSRNNNPGNIAQFDRLGTEGVAGYKTLQEGVDAVAKNLAWRKVDTTELDQEISGFVNQVQSGALTANQALNEVSKGKKPALIDALSNITKPEDTEADDLARGKMQAAINLKDHKGLNSSVGPVPGTRLAIGDVFGAKADFTAKVDQLISDLSLTSLIEAKSRGATFGALSDTEMKILSSSATTMASWRKENILGSGTDHYAIDEKRFKEELDNISKIFKRAISSTMQEPEPVSANSDVIPLPQNDGTTWVQNEDGSYTLID